MRRVTFVILIFIFFSASCFAQELTVMSFNIRYSNNHDGINGWKFRKQWIADFVDFQDTDIVGFQEVMDDMYPELQSLMPGYSSIHMPSDTGKPNGEYEAVSIFYKKENLKLLDSGTFWLSETPEKPSKGWDAICNRICTWGKFQHSNSGKTFYLFNTHLSHVGENARRNASQVILDKIKNIAKGQPVVLCGDFNTKPDSPTYNYITSALIDSRKIAKKVYAPNYTGTPFEWPVKDNNIIDYIFINDKLEVAKFAAYAEQRLHTKISDHLPLLVNLKIK